MSARKIRAVSHKCLPSGGNVIKELLKRGISTVVESSIVLKPARCPVHGIELYLAELRSRNCRPAGLMRAVTELGLAGDGLAFICQF